jgi:hypothetical protein
VNTAFRPSSPELAYIFRPTVFMPQWNAEKDWIVTVREVTKNNLLIRLARCLTIGGTIKYAIFVLALNGKPGEMTLINAISGIDIESATAIFDDANRVLRSYSWPEGTYLLEDGQ